MILVLLAMLFLLELQLDWEPKAQLLTLRDVKEILEVTLPKREFSSTEILLHIENKHLCYLKDFLPKYFVKHQHSGEIYIMVSNVSEAVLYVRGSNRAEKFRYPK